MNLIEVLISILIISLITFVSVNILLLKTEDVNSYISFVDKNIKKISLYNYSNYLIDSCNSGVCTGYIYVQENKIFTSSIVTPYYYHCKVDSFDKIGYFDNLSGKIAYCKIIVNDLVTGNIIYNYKIK